MLAVIAANSRRENLCMLRIFFTKHEGDLLIELDPQHFNTTNTVHTNPKGVTQAKPKTMISAILGKLFDRCLQHVCLQKIPKSASRARIISLNQ